MKTTQPTTLPSNIKITDINVPFISIVGFMVKASFAAVPAVIIIAISWAWIASSLTVITPLISNF